MGWEEFILASCETPDSPRRYMILKEWDRAGSGGKKRLRWGERNGHLGPQISASLNHAGIINPKKQTLKISEALLQITCPMVKKNSPGSSIYFLFINQKIYNNVKYLPQNSQILFSSPKNFPCSEFVCGMWGLWGQLRVHTRAKMASPLGSGVCRLSNQAVWDHNRPVPKTWTSSLASQGLDFFIYKPY